MTTLDGRSLKEGVAIAAAAVITSATGISGISPDILQLGVDALRKQLPEADRPEVVILCDKIEAALCCFIPGIQVIGIAAESDSVPEDADPAVPCVVGVRNLMMSAAAEDIVVLDGDEGLVHIDPDPKTLIRYQERDEARARSHPVFIEASHIPARTQAGETVLVYARASDEADLTTAVTEGADGLIVEPFEPYGRECYETTLRIALGKPTAMLASFADKDLLRAAGRLASGDQVTALFPASHFATLSRRMTEALEHVADELRTEDLEPPRISMGVMAIADADMPLDSEAGFYLVDLRPLGKSRRKQAWVEKVAGRWVSRGGAGRVAFDIGNRVNLVADLVSAGARNIVTAPDAVSRTKNAIREIGLEEVD